MRWDPLPKDLSLQLGPWLVDLSWIWDVNNMLPTYIDKTSWMHGWCGYCSTILRIHDVLMSMKCQVSSIINSLIYWTIHFVGSNRLDNTILTRLHASCLLTGWLHSNRRTADRRCVGSCSPTGAQHILYCAKKRVRVRKGLHNLLYSVQEWLLG